MSIVNETFARKIEKKLGIPNFFLSPEEATERKEAFITEACLSTLISVQKILLVGALLIGWKIYVYMSEEDILCPLSIDVLGPVTDQDIKNLEEEIMDENYRNQMWEYAKAIRKLTGS